MSYIVSHNQSTKITPDYHHGEETSRHAQPFLLKTFEFESLGATKIKQ